MAKKKLTREEQEDKAIKDILKFAKLHNKTLKTVEKLKKELLGIQELDKRLKQYKDYLRLCDMMLRREDTYIKQMADELGIRLKSRD